MPQRDLADNWSAQHARFGPYQIQGEISRGGMGIVYRAFHPEMDRDVALKVMLAGWQASDEDLARFDREARAMASLQHPGIVRVLDSGMLEDTPYYAMELISGQPLDELIQGRVLTRAEIIRLGIETCEALQHAHENNILHRDLKPGNVLIDEDCRAKLFDFGLAKLLRSDGSKLTQSGWIVGTPNYMSPEQARGKPLTTASDIFSMGAMLYEMLTGELAFPGSDGNQVLRGVIEHHPPPPSTHDPTIGPTLDAICLKALRKDPDERYLSAKVMAHDLRNHDRRQQIIAHGPRPLTRLRAHLAAHRLAWLLTLLGGVCLLGLACWQIQIFRNYKKRIAALEHTVDSLARAHSDSLGKVRLGRARTDYFQARLLAERGRHTEALVLFREAWRQDPSFAEAREGLAETLETLGRQAAARGALNQARRYLTETIRQSPSRVGALLALAEVARKQPDLERAHHYASRYVRLRPRDIEGYLELGTIELARGQVPRAHELARLAISLQARSHRAWRLLGHGLLAVGQTQKAIDALERSIRYKPSRAAHHRRAYAYYTLGKLELARRDVDTALKLAPGDIRSYLLRGMIGLRQQSAQAQADLEQVLRGHTPSQLETAACHATALYHLGSGEKALTALRRWHRLDPHNLEVLRMSAELLERLERYREARRAWVEVLRRKGNDRRALSALRRLRDK